MLEARRRTVIVWVCGWKFGLVAREWRTAVPSSPAPRTRMFVGDIWLMFIYIS